MLITSSVFAHLFYKVTFLCLLTFRIHFFITHEIKNYLNLCKFKMFLLECFHFKFSEQKIKYIYFIETSRKFFTILFIMSSKLPKIKPNHYTYFTSLLKLYSNKKKILSRTSYYLSKLNSN